MQPLEVLIAVRGDHPDVLTSVRGQFVKSDVYCLGQPAGDMGGGGAGAGAGAGTESDLLHFTVDDADGAERVMLPVFTRPELMREALLRNPDWQSLSVVQVGAQALLENIDAEVVIVINPWSRLEFHLPPAPAPPPPATEPA